MKKISTLLFGAMVVCSTAFAADAMMDSMHKMDKNGDGMVTKEEAMKGGMKESDFMKMDMNKDGNISIEEWKKMYQETFKG